MCKSGNQTIFHQCAEKLPQRDGKPAVSNKDAQQTIKREGGCLSK